MKRDELALALKLAQPCITVAEYTPILVHYCFDKTSLFTYDAVSAITVNFKTGLQCALRGETLLKLVELAGDDIELAMGEQCVEFKSGRREAIELPYLAKSDFLWKGMPSVVGHEFEFNADLLQGWRMCAATVAKDARQLEWTALAFRLGAKPVLASHDGSATTRYTLTSALGKKEQLVLIPKSVVDQVLWIESLLELEKPIRATISNDYLRCDFVGEQTVTLIGKLMPGDPFDFDAALKASRPNKERQQLPDGFGDAIERVLAVRARENDNLCSLHCNGKELRVYGNGTLGNAETKFKLSGASAHINCDPAALSRYLPSNGAAKETDEDDEATTKRNALRVDQLSLSNAGAVLYAGGDKFVQFVSAAA